MNRMKHKKVLDIKQFIHLYGVKHIAQLIEAKPITVYSWLYQGRYPSVEFAYRLIKKSNGLLTWQSIYSYYEKDFDQRFTG